MKHSIREYQAHAESVLEGAIHSVDVPERLQAAMLYSAVGGGKRLRALLVYAAGAAMAAPQSRLDSVAAAVECIHAYSLIHDDLPAMDDDDLRRGQPTSHIKFDDATAILAGDALQTLAFRLVNSPNSELSDSQCREISFRLADGSVDMVSGQILDVLATGQSLQRAELENMHRLKTGALINAAVICGALCADNPAAEKFECLRQYANFLGLAYQVIDDVLDIESNTETLGKTSGADQAMGKSTYPALIGLQESKNLAQILYQQAIESIEPIGDNKRLLLEIAELVVERKH